jgi:hypothetical protein
MNWRGTLRRSAAFAAVEVLIAMTWYLKWPIAACAALQTWAVNNFGPCAAERVGEDMFSTCGKLYRVVHWCTPVWIWTGVLFMFTFTGMRAVRALLFTAALSCVALGGSIANTVLSVWLVRTEWSWYIIHTPGTVIVYLSVYLIALFVIRSQRLTINEELTR